MSQPSASLDVLTDEQQQLVEENLSLVRRIGSRWRSRCRTQVEYADLLQVGALGLVDAARRFDSRRDGTFAAFATQRIRGSICDALRAIDPLTRGRRLAVRQLEAGMQELGTLEGREPEESELCKHLGWEVEAVRQAQGDLAALGLGWAQTLEWSDDEPSASGVSTPRDSEGAAFSQLLEKERKQLLADAIRELPSQQQQVLALYYEEGLTMKEIGDVFEVTESRVSQIHGAAVTLLRRRISNIESTVGATA